MACCAVFAHRACKCAGRCRTAFLNIHMRACCLQAEMARWMGPDAVRATMMGQMRDAMKEDVEKLLQVCTVCSLQ